LTHELTESRRKSIPASILYLSFLRAIYLAVTLASRKDRTDRLLVYKEGKSKAPSRKGTAEPPQDRLPTRQL
jgi:hypothetical protein